MVHVDWLDTGLNHVWLPYTQMQTTPMPAAVTGMQGTTLHLANGQSLIDGIGSWWTCAHGYNHPALKQALIRQLDTLPHVMLGGLAHEPAYRLATRLAALTPGDLTRVFFTESGSVAVEVAMKVAVQSWRNQGIGGRTRFVAFKGGYHGDTFATMSICDPDEGMHAFFGDALSPQYIADLPDTPERCEALMALLDDHSDIAGVIVEPLVQGAGGMRMHSAETLAAIRLACDVHGIPLIFDEVFTGFGRTGHMFAADRAGVTPDIMTVGKALTGGVTPLAATIVSQRLYDTFHDIDPDKALMHGPTFTGHALGCAVAMASIDLLENPGVLSGVLELEKRMSDMLAPLADHRAVENVRVMGAVSAVEMKKGFDVEASRARFIDRGVFIRPLGRVIYLTPAFCISAEDLSALIDAISSEVDVLAA